MDVRSFSEIEAEFLERVYRMIWCNVATVDGRGRPRSRLLHPIWEGMTGWIATHRHSHKSRHLAHNSGSCSRTHRPRWASIPRRISCGPTTRSSVCCVSIPGASRSSVSRRRLRPRASASGAGLRVTT